METLAQSQAYRNSHFSRPAWFCVKVVSALSDDDRRPDCE